MKKLRCLWITVPCIAGLGLAAAEIDAHQMATGSTVKTQANASSAEDDFQAQLLDLAMQAATQIPIEPHVKDRSRAQEEVVAAYLRLNHTEQALQAIPKIADWRRGAAYADFALHLVQTADARDAGHYLALAQGVAQTAEDWRRERINGKIARVRSLMQDRQRAENQDDPNAALVDKQKCDDLLNTLANAAAERNLDSTRDALEAAAEHFDKFYQDTARRTHIEEQMKAAWESVPQMLRITLLMTLSESALKHSDPAKALALINEAQALLDAFKWSQEYRISSVAKLAALRFRAGEATTATSQIVQAMSQFDTDRQMIMGIEQAGVWRAIAEAQKTMSQDQAALESYRKAIELGADNPNARPRALDLSATCRSMAVSSVEPDSQMWNRLYQLREGLTHPW
jgi:hypothetical protein